MRKAAFAFVEYFLRVIVTMPSGGSTMIKDESKPKLLRRLKRIAGQVTGVQKMVEEDRYCADILTQIAAIRAALDAVGAEVLTDHISGCVMKQGKEHPQAHSKTPDELEAELRTLLTRLQA
jgi:DNA-binding FrmR family transcriptional regulator